LESQEPLTWQHAPHAALLEFPAQAAGQKPPSMNSPPHWSSHCDCTACAQDLLVLPSCGQQAPNTVSYESDEPASEARDDAAALLSAGQA